MTKLLLEINKEIAKASKVFNKASAIIDNGRYLDFKNLSDKKIAEYNNAHKDYQTSDRALTALYPMREKIESLINNN